MTSGGFDYLDEVSKDAGSKPSQTANLATKQKGFEPAPVDGGEGFIGGNDNASSVGMNFVTGKKGSVESRPIWSEQTGDNDETFSQQKAGDSEPMPTRENTGTDSTEEGADWAHTEESQDLPKTFWGNKGAGTGDSSTDSPESNPKSYLGSQEKDKEGFAYLEEAAKSGKPVNVEEESIEPHPTPESGDESFSDMPQTENTSMFGDGAPRFKHRG